MDRVAVSDLGLGSVDIFFSTDSRVCRKSDPSNRGVDGTQMFLEYSSKILPTIFNDLKSRHAIGAIMNVIRSSSDNE